MEFDYAPYTHFYSHETKVSLELPAGWEEEREEADTAIYYYDVDDADEDDDLPTISPRLVVKAIAVGSNASGKHIELADGVRDSDSLHNREIIDREEGTLDGQPAVFDTFTFDENGTRVVQHMAHAQIDDVVFSLIGVVEAAYADAFLDAIKDGVRSVRFILLPA